MFLLCCLIGGGLIHIRDPERTNSSKDAYSTRDGKIVCNPPTSPLIYIQSTTDIKTWTLRTSSRVVAWSPVVLFFLLAWCLSNKVLADNICIYPGEEGEEPK